jgi:hypothetical protein
MSDWTSANAEVRSCRWNYAAEEQRISAKCQIPDPPPIDLAGLSDCHGAHFDDAAVWEFDDTRPIVSTPDAVDELAALGFKHGRLPVRLRRNQ